MKKVLKYSFIFLLLLCVFAPVHFTHAENYTDYNSCLKYTNGDSNFCSAAEPSTAPAPKTILQAATPDQAAAAGTGPGAGVQAGVVPGATPTGGCGISIKCYVWQILAWVTSFILMITSWLLWLAGMALDWVLNYTILQWSANISAMTGINTVWKVIRDLSNIIFIFILLWEAIKLILSFSDTAKIKSIIAGIILTALLINFSLFFTKVIIDASNVVTVGFYQAIVGSGDAQQANNAGGQAAAVGNQFTIQKGISGAFVNQLNMVSFYASQDPSQISNAGDDNKSITIINLGGSVMFLVLAFVFFAVGIMYLIRYITLIVLMMSAPIGYIGFGGLSVFKGTQSQWWNTLLGQIIFAPLWMFCCWAILMLVGSPGFLTLQGGTSLHDLAAGSGFAAIYGGNNGVASSSGIPLIINFVLIIALIVGSLTLAKQKASQGSKLVGEWTGKATAFAGGAIMGGAAMAGRTSIGRIGNVVANNANLQDAAANKKGITGAAARLAFYASKKARSGSFDVRNATIPTSAVGDLVEGTVGRTRAGKALGLNDVNIPSIAIGSMAAGMAGVGKGGTKGFKETREESQKRVHDREAAATSELALANARKDVKSGANADPTTPAGIDAIDKMEKALAKLSTKEIETLVASNRGLLDSLNFANKISVQQLEALNKSDQFSESEKGRLKNARFSNINTAMATGTPAAIGAIRSNIRDLSDSELEMIDSSYLRNEHFVSHLKSGQMETINKSNKFTTTQKNNLRTTRQVPLMTALGAHNIADTRAAVRELGHKEVASLEITTLINPTMMESYTPQMLKRMAPEMSPNKVTALHDAIENAGTTPGCSAEMTRLATWLGTPDGAILS